MMLLLRFRNVDTTHVNVIRKTLKRFSYFNGMMYIRMEYSNATNIPTIVEIWFVPWYLLTLSLFMSFWKNLLQEYMYSQFLRIFATVREISLAHESTGRTLYERYFGWKFNMVFLVQRICVVYCCVCYSGQRGVVRFSQERTKVMRTAN
jgi:hypothetical protein